MNTVLVVAAHPDDEVLGCAGTIALHNQSGDQVHVLFLADGEQSRPAHQQQQSARQAAARAAGEALGVTSVQFLSFADNAMDSVPILQIVQAIEPVIAQLAPDTIYTHFGGDLNIDHRISYQAVLTACRPQPGHSVRRIYCFEVPSSTEWAAQSGPVFRPTLFIDTHSVQDKVEAALHCYAIELRPFPHARSMQAILARQQLRGSSVGLPLAEAFMIERELRAKP
ncbi:PIG-L family deacetylase [Alkalimonas sp.]|uniref:PIG-L deacetylase family protein n=1 Tax=Alkalimonas sp. TaxID=1872453 RepID=UPI00263AAFC0|nr:PIG-L family deacetylase [Alkalimonas sp.]MCC5827209.1 PIG-L family deacetylase [Alkalimonas sp.]